MEGGTSVSNGTPGHQKRGENNVNFSEGIEGRRPGVRELECFVWMPSTVPFFLTKVESLRNWWEERESLEEKEG